MGKITIITLGSGDERYLTKEGDAVLRCGHRVVLRTQRHPIAAYLRREGVAFETLDSLYEECETFDAFNQAAAAALLADAKDGDLCYGVSDPAFDGTVFALERLKPQDVALGIIPGAGLAERCLALVNRQQGGVRIYAAEEFLQSRVSPEEPLLLCELHSKVCAGECKLRLTALMPEDMTVSLLTGDPETGELARRDIPLLELDRQAVYDHLTAVYVPPVSMLRRTRFDMDDLIRVMTRLRAQDGCPWDKEQTHETLLTSLLEECYEFIQTVRDNDPEHMYDELGDVLLQVVFHAEIARQCGEFDILDVTTAICQKMMERHPHIFGSERADTAEQVLENWDAIKRRQRGIATVGQAMDDVSEGLSPLMRAAKIQHKAAKVGFDFASAKDALEKVYEEAGEVAECLDNHTDPEEELGDLLFSAVNVVRLSGKNGDIALYRAVSKFVSRFKRMEQAVKNDEKCLDVGVQ